MQPGVLCFVLTLIAFRILFLAPYPIFSFGQSQPQRGSLPPLLARSAHGRSTVYGLRSTMVVFPPLLARNGVRINTNFTYPESTPPTFLVMCAYPLSGLYGPGIRYLYYGLVAVCIFARRHKWLQEPCLAAALLFPALASIHAIIMARYSDSGKYHSISLYYSH